MGDAPNEQRSDFAYAAMTALLGVLAGGLGVLAFAPIFDSTIASFSGTADPVPIMRILWPSLGVLIGAVCFRWAYSTTRRTRTVARLVGGCVVLAVVTGAHAAWGPPVFRTILLVCAALYLVAVVGLTVYRRAEARGHA